MLDCEICVINQTVVPFLSALNFSSNTPWILFVLFTIGLSGISKVFLDHFLIVLCLSVCPSAPERQDCKIGGGIPFPGLITEADGSDMSWLKRHLFCHSCLAADLTNDAVGCCHMPLGTSRNRMGVYPLSYVQECPDADSAASTRFAHLFDKEKQITAAVFSVIVLPAYFPPSSSSCPACVLLSPVSVGLRRGAEASLTGVWVLITHVCALISGLQLPASSLLHASEWGYISLSLWPETFLSISFGLFSSLCHRTNSHTEDACLLLHAEGFRHHFLKPKFCRTYLSLPWLYLV